MKVLVACEESQRVTIELRKLGNEAYSCDLLECSGKHPEWHIKKVPKNSLYGMFGESQDTERDRINYLMETHSFTLSKRYSYRDVEKVCGDCSHFNACMQGNQTIAPTCCMFDSLYKARKNPEWHHVSLNTLANIDFDMLDEKRQIYFTVYRDLQETLSHLRKCKTVNTYSACYNRFVKRLKVMWGKSKITNAMYKYIEAKLSMQNVESGLW